MADEEKKELPADGGGDEKPKSNLPIIVGIIAAVILLEGVGLFVFMQMTKPKDPEKEKAKMQADSLKAAQSNSNSVGVVTKPISVVVNIAGTDKVRFLKVEVVLAYDDVKFKMLGAELDKRMPLFKNILIDILSEMTLPDLKEIDSKKVIRKEVKKKINASLPENIGEISDVYINEFIIQ